MHICLSMWATSMCQLYNCKKIISIAWNYIIALKKDFGFK